MILFLIPKLCRYSYGIIKHRQSIFTFLKYPNVPPDNNASEKAVRNVKVKTKISGAFRNKDAKGCTFC
ncbi:MAG: transposase [Prevotellaceae bacterium]|jgi:uncharacterized Fe-S cluster protein YjdI|nr:transposase [Prevotellaceae bacterium]